MAGARPDSQGVPLTRWSLPRLSAPPRRARGSRSRRVIWARCWREAGLSFQRTRTWKASPDPDYEAKAARILALCEQPPPDGPVVSFDQMGPVSLRPTAGRGLGAAAGGPSGSAPTTTAAPASATSSAPTTSTPTGSASGCARNEPAATCSPSCARSGSPTRAGSGSTGSRTTSRPTGCPPIRAFAAANKIELVPTPTYASYLNPVECHFSAITEFVVTNADYLDWDAFGYALAHHVRYRNGDHRDRRLAAAEATTPHRRLMTFRVQPNFKGH